MADKVFELTVYKLLLYKSTNDYAFNCDSSITLVDENDSQEPTNVITGILLSVDVNKRIGTHNNIKVRLKIVQSTTNDEQKLNVTMLKNAFLGRKIRLDMIKDGKSYVIAENYYVFGAKPMKYKSDGAATYYVDLNIYSWDKLMDITKHSKSYAEKRLGGDILNGFMNGYKEKYQKLNLPECLTSGMRVMVGKPEGGENKEPAELAFPSLEQYDETDYNFLLRNANKCGEFLYFENGTLNLGLTRIFDGEANGSDGKEVVTDIKESSYASIESLFDEINDDEALEAFGEEDAGFKLSANKLKAESVNGVSGTPQKPVKDKESDWDCVFAPQWSRVLAHVFQYGSLASFIVDTTEEEMSVRGYKTLMTDKFNSKVVDPYNKSLSNKGNKVLCKYTPDDILFRTMDKAKLNVSDNQYRITFDDGQMNLRLGDLVSCDGIINGGQFVVVDVHSVFEKEDAVDDAKIVNRMEVTVIPVYNDCPVPLPANTGFRSSAALLGSPGPNMGSTPNGGSGFTMRTATVEVSDDPYRLNQVQVKYDGDKEKSSEWVKVLTPFASSDVGISCKLNVGDKVVVLQNAGATEPFVIGSYYNGDNTPPCGQRKFSSIIRSNNGQYIGFISSKSVTDIFASLFPGFKMLKNIIPQMPSALPTWDAEGDALQALGGIEISDGFGFFTIAASSSQRRITISSPFGTVGIDAAMGITISAPNGNVKIVGKNVDIVAGNNLTLKSGANIDTCLLSSLWNKGANADTFAEIGKSEAESALSAISGLFDFPALRFVFELVFKPIAGTLNIHSGRYLLLEAGNSETSLPADVQPTWKAVTLSSTIADQRGEAYPARVRVLNLIKRINEWVANYQSFIDKFSQQYENGKQRRSDLSSYLKKVQNKKADFNVEAFIDKWIDEEKEVKRDDISKNVYDKSYDDIDEDLKNIVNYISDEIPNLRNIKEIFNDNAYKEEIIKDAVIRNELYGFAKESIIDFTPNVKLFKEQSILKEDNKIKTNLRKGVCAILSCDTQLISFSQKKKDEVCQNDMTWAFFIESIKSNKEIKKGAVGEVLGKFANDIVENLFPVDTISNIRSWGQDAKGQILMSQDSGSTLSINGQTIKKVDTGELDNLKEAIRNATL